MSGALVGAHAGRQLRVYGDVIISEFKKCNPNAVIWDAKAQGRPDMVDLTWKLMMDMDGGVLCEQFQGDEKGRIWDGKKEISCLWPNFRLVERGCCA